jgi:hypothetical protein
MGPVSAQTGTSRLAPGLPLSAGSGRLLDGAGTARFDYSFRNSARRYEIETLQRSDVPECQFRKVHDMLFQLFGDYERWGPDYRALDFAVDQIRDYRYQLKCA